MPVPKSVQRERKRRKQQKDKREAGARVKRTCVACDGTGVSSKGGECRPCGGKGEFDASNRLG